MDFLDRKFSSISIKPEEPRSWKERFKKKNKIGSTTMCEGDVLPSTLIIIDARDSPDPLVVHLAGQLPWSRLVEALQPRQFNNNLL